MSIENIKDNNKHISEGVKQKIRMTKFKQDKIDAIELRDVNYLVLTYCLKNKLLSLYYSVRIAKDRIQILMKEYFHKDFIDISYDKLNSYDYGLNGDIEIVKIDIDGSVKVVSVPVLWSRLIETV